MVSDELCNKVLERLAFGGVDGVQECETLRGSALGQMMLCAGQHVSLTISERPAHVRRRVFEREDRATRRSMPKA